MATKKSVLADIDENLARLASMDDGRRRSLASRLEAVESDLRTLERQPRRRIGLIEDRDEIVRQMSGKPVSLPRWSEKRGWHGGDRRTLYLFSLPRPDGVIASNVYPGDRLPEAADHRSSVRVATRAEAEEMYQDPLHVGWNVA
jgi:hypothetical protein